MEHTKELSQFLTSLFLSKYTAMFEKEGATCVEDLKMFSEEELRTDFGVKKVHARKLIKALNSFEEKKTPQEEAPGHVNWAEYCEDSEYCEDAK